MYKHILVPIAPGHEKEASEPLEAARRLLGGGGRISVLSVLEELPAFVGSYFPREQLAESISDASASMKAELERDGVTVNVISGHPTNAILTWAEKHSVDCIVVSSHRPGLSDYLLGTTAARVVRHALCSVVVLR